MYKRTTDDRNAKESINTTPICHNIKGVLIAARVVNNATFSPKTFLVKYSIRRKPA
jgi:hypothetical protein